MNSVNLTGRLVNDPVRRDTARVVVAEFPVAVDGRIRIWLDVESRGHLAGTAAAHLHAGRHVAVTGRWAQREYHDRNGHHRRRDFVVADHLTYLDAPSTAPAGSEPPPSEASVRADKTAGRT